MEMTKKWHEKKTKQKKKQIIPQCGNKGIFIFPLIADYHSLFWTHNMYQISFEKGPLILLGPPEKFWQQFFLLTKKLASNWKLYLPFNSQS